MATSRDAEKSNPSDVLALSAMRSSAEIANSKSLKFRSYNLSGGW